MPRRLHSTCFLLPNGSLVPEGFIYCSKEARLLDCFEWAGDCPGAPQWPVPAAAEEWS